MKKRITAFLLVLVMVVSLLPVSALAADHSVSYVTEAVVKDENGKTTEYTNVVKNWGTRGELATYLSPMAEEFYGNLTYSSLSDYTATQLQSLMADGYTLPSYDDAKYLLAYTDCEENGYYISDFYTGQDISPIWDGGSTWNREHTWPQSKFSGGDTDDLILLRPVTSTVNSSRGNAAYGESNGYFKPNSLSEDKDIRGDVARNMIYGRVRWGMTNMFGTNGVIESAEVLLAWMEADPVDTWEMGRNDVIQSIYGTRNVFVDYPELAFIVLGEEVPDTMQTPTGSVLSNDYEIVAVSGNEAYGTVHVNGNTVTAMAKTGYEAVGYVLLSGEATVTRNHDVFTVLGDCTIRIQFAEQTPGTVNYNQKGVIAATETYTPGEMIFMPEYQGTAPSGYQFVGWVTDTLSDTDTRPAGVLRPGDPYKVVSGTNNIYALYSYMDMSVGGEQWVLVTSASQLAVNDRVVITAKDYEKAMSTEQKNNNRAVVDITKNADNTITWSGKTVQILTLQAGTVSGTYAFYTGSGYLYAASSSANHLKTGTLNANASWNITVSAAGAATIKSAGSFTRNVMRYNTSLLIACYLPNNQQKDLSIYKAVSSGTTMYTIGACTHENIDTLYEVSASCIEPGLTEGLQCLDCGLILQEQVEIPAFGHTEGESVEYILRDPTCTAPGLKQVLVFCATCSETLKNDADVEIPALGHGEPVTQEYILSEPTCTDPGVKQVISYCSVCYDVLSDNPEVEIPALEHSYENGSCTYCGKSETDAPAVELFDIDVARMILGNSLKFQFGVDQSKIPDTTGYYALIEKEWADGAVTTKKISASEWGTVGQYYAIEYDGLAAKEMADDFYVTIFDAEGKQVSKVKKDAVRDYVSRAYEDQKETGRTMMVDMLNYGAAAQVYFKYGMEDLANSLLTDEQKDSGTAETPEMENKVVKGEHYTASRFILKSSIQVQVGFEGLSEDMYAVYTYVDYKGLNRQYRVEGENFVVSDGKLAGVELSKLVYADARCMVSVTIYNADGTVYGTATDSIESCAYRSNGDLFVALMKFADSARINLSNK